jgi:hypothetical protein
MFPCAPSGLVIDPNRRAQGWGGGRRDGPDSCGRRWRLHLSISYLAHAYTTFVALRILSGSARALGLSRPLEGAYLLPGALRP